MLFRSLGHGAIQGGTLGFGEELGAAALTPFEKARRAVSSYIPGTSENIDQQLREQGFKLPEEKGVYQELRDVTREANKRASDVNPYIYLAGELLGGFVPVTGIAGKAIAAGKGATTAAKAAKGVVGGAELGAGVGLGTSEADLTKGELGQAAKETALGAGIGGTVGGMLPIAGQIIKPLLSLLVKE